MPLMHMQDGTPVWVKGTFKKIELCAFCPCFSTKLCDYPTGPNKRDTCSLPICDACATVIGTDRDHCPMHASHKPAQGVLAL